MSSRDKCDGHEKRIHFPSSSVHTEYGSACEDNSSMKPEHYKEHEYDAAFNNSASMECADRESKKKAAPEERVSAEGEEEAAPEARVCIKINQGAADETAALDGSTSPERHGKKSPKQVDPALSGISSENHSKGETKQEMPLELLVSRLGMTDYLKRKKLSLTAILDINEKNINPTEDPIQSLSSVCWLFLRKLCRVNVMARDVRYTENTELKGNLAQDIDQTLNDLLEYEVSDDNINPLDLITALFLCSDGLLQQEMALKMSLCQFSVPLLLPNCDTQQCTLMLWALRDIVKSYKPHSLLESGGFEENSIVLMDLPMISFVRLGRISMSKSHILNQVFNNPQQHHDTFVHHNMKNGNISRKISNGMVEISWYLPGGKSDIFTEPLAVANLRGDIRSHQTGFRFLCQTSAAVFVFIDDFKENISLLKPQDSKAPLFLICDLEKIDKDDFRNHIHDLKFNTNFIIMKGRQMNDAQFVDKLRSTITQSVSSDCAKMSIEKMSAVSRELQILVDEDNDLCQKAKETADAITASISDIPKYKQNQLPLQGEILKKLAKLEKEECRPKNAESKNILTYKNELIIKKQDLRKQQVSKDVTQAMSKFIFGLLVCKEERAYFLKWMRINLDNLSRKHVVKLKQDYKKACKDDVGNNELILDLENQMSCSSLGIEHFLREMGQLYESVVSIPEPLQSKQKMEMIKDLPKVCAEMMLEGFPLELVDGDAGYIPLTWVSAVLNELHSMEQNLKIRVVTVVGVQSTGKSTLLNTMFGVQFAVSSGRCTRGAFMLLVRVNEGFREQLGCDFIMVIDTEGLRSPKLAQLADSYEHDNELATLVVGLSDLTIINIAMENSSEMQEVLQIVIHAFFRMKEVNKKSHCQFVHQNVGDVTAHDKSENDRKILLDQLNTITQAAAKMERKGEDLKFTDIIEYSDRDNFYIPSLWQGTPPMASVSAGYSESVVQVKKCIIDTMIDLKGKRPSQTVKEFQEWTSRLWQSVKYENFIFSFRNSIVAEAYSKLCEQYNKWDWDFRREMREWMVKAENKVLNFGTVTQNPAENIENFLMKQKNEVVRKLVKAEQQLNDNLAKYFENPQNHVHLVERYKQDFLYSIKSLRQETENKMMRRLEELLRIKKGRNELEKIKENQAKMMEEKVSELLGKCRKSKDSFSDDQLDKEFEQMWNHVVKELPSESIKEQNVSEDIYFTLHKDLENRSGSAMEILSHHTSDRCLEDCGREDFVVEMNLSSGKIDEYMEGSGMKTTKEFMKTSEQLIENCQNFIADKASQTPQMDYDSTYIREMLIMINDYFQQNEENLSKNVELQTNLKIHICGIAARQFNEMHKDYIQNNDPLLCLEKDKDQYYRDFKDLYHETDQAQRKAEEFTRKGLEPSVRKYITDYLDSDIREKMESGPTGMKFRTHSFFQYYILQQLLEDHQFEKFIQFITNYKQFVKDWIVAEIKSTFSEKNCKVSTLEIKRLEETVGYIQTAIEEARKISEENTGEQSINHFIDNIRKHLDDKLIISPDALKKVKILNNATIKQFSTWLISYVDNMKHSLISEFQKDEDISAKLEKLPFKPQDELFSRMLGCGEMCPFCMVPCEAGGDKHDAHYASFHRPTGIRGCKWQTFKMLSTDACSYLVASEKRFISSETDEKQIPFKNNRNIYPEWNIQSDTSIQATDYWKYVFAQFNEKFAKEYGATPAYLPPDWLQLKREDANKCLDKEFMLK